MYKGNIGRCCPTGRRWGTVAEENVKMNGSRISFGTAAVRLYGGTGRARFQFRPLAPESRTTAIDFYACRNKSDLSACFRKLAGAIVTR